MVETGGNLAMEPYLEGMRLVRPTTDNSNILRFMKKPTKAVALKHDPVLDEK